MSLTPQPASFTLEDIEHSAADILSTRPDAIPAYRLLSEVLRLPVEDIELQRAKQARAESVWVRQLEEAQLADGSWGRFHSQDTKQRTAFRTTEEAINRAFALGLESNHRVLTRASGYILKVLQGKAHITDRDEKNEAWPYLIKLMLAGRLAQIDPTHAELDPYWNNLGKVARQAFTTGTYCLEDEAEAFLRLSGVHVPQGFLESQHTLWILAARPLPAKVEHMLVDWIWNKPDGIRYLRAPLSQPQPRLIAYWLRSLNILTRFAAWRGVSVEGLNQLWNQRDAQGLWDFSSQIARCVDFPLSESWRKPSDRKKDYSTCLLVLLRRFFD